jgi:NDP-sugar pyrophosphorylase family protein
MIKSYVGNGRRYGVEITYSYETGQLLGTAGALKQAGGMLEETFFTMYGDSYLCFDFHKASQYFNRSDKPAMMTVYKNRGLFDRSNVVMKDNLVIAYDKTHQQEGMVFIDYGVMLLTKEILKTIPGGQPYSLEQFLQPLVAQKQVLAYQVFQRFYEIGSTTGIDAFTKYIRSLK